MNGAALIVALGLALLPLASRQARADACTDALIRAEKSFDIPRGLLVSIALVESGHEGIPQAYAMNVGGHAVIATDTDDARRFIHDQHGNIRNDVYVGCMQLSVYNHREKFRPVDRILDPEANVRYAANFMRRLRTEEGNWSRAVAKYQGGSNAQQQDYVCKVWRHLSALDGASAAQLDHGRCGGDLKVAIAPETRRAYGRAQVAELPE